MYKARIFTGNKLLYMYELAAMPLQVYVLIRDILSGKNRSRKKIAKNLITSIIK